MTSLTASRRGLPRRRRPVSPLRRATRAVLVAGSVVALAAAFGPVWAVRIGLAIAVAAALAAVLLAWRELTAERRAHAAAMAAASRAHGMQLHAERDRNAAVLDTLSARARALSARNETQRRHLTQLGADLSVARSDSARLTREVARRDNQIGTLRRTVREQAGEIDDLRDRLADATAGPDVQVQPDAPESAAALETTGAEVHVLPRRMWIDQPAAVAELDLGDARPRSRQLSATDPILMPNYEDELRLA